MTRLGPATAAPLSALHRSRSSRRYHFNLNDGETLLLDQKGVHLPDTGAALRHAEQLARGFKWIRWSIHVTDEEGNTIGRIE